MADYLSRRPGEMNGSVIKAEMVWNEWFTVNSLVSCLNIILEDSAQPRDSDKTVEIESEKANINHVKGVKSKRPIRLRETRKRWNQVSSIGVLIKLKTRMSQTPSIRLINEKLLPANYVTHETIRRVIAILKNYNRTAVS